LRSLGSALAAWRPQHTNLGVRRVGWGGVVQFGLCSTCRPCTQVQPRAGLREIAACGRRLEHRGQLCRRALPERPSPQCGSRECLLASGPCTQPQIYLRCPSETSFRHRVFRSISELTPAVSFRYICNPLLVGPSRAGLQRRWGSICPTVLQGATSREHRPTLSPPGCNRLGGGDLGSGVSGERGDL